MLEIITKIPKKHSDVLLEPIYIKAITLVIITFPYVLVKALKLLVKILHKIPGATL